MKLYSVCWVAPIFVVHLMCKADTALGARSNKLPAENTACQSSRPNLPVSDNPSEYLTCTPVREKMNIWRRRRCTRDTTFLARSQKCVSKRAVKRQESLCRAQPNAHVCQNRCEPAQIAMAAGGVPLPNVAAPGAPCLWTEAPLEPFGLNPAYFLQCNPTSLGSVCGAWNQMQCSNGTIFNVLVQVCVSLALSPASCPAGEIPMFSCGPNQWCPDGAACRDNVCCQGVVSISQAESNGVPYYPAPPLPTLYPNVQQPIEPPTPPPNGQPQGPGTESPPQPPSNRPPMGPAIPGQTYIQFPSGIILAPTDPKHPVDQAYPSGGQQIHPAQPGMTSIFQPGIIHVYPGYPQVGGSSGQGAGQVFPGYTRNQGGEVMLPPGPPSYPGFYIPSPEYQGSNSYPGSDRQPNNNNNLVPRGQPEPFTQPPVTLYPSSYGAAATPAPHGTYAGVVPPLPPRYLPVCHDGRSAVGFCKLSYECPDHHGCIPAGGCCPLPQCSNGAYALSFCQESQDCSGGQFCLNGGCCPSLVCPSGEPAQQSCDAYHQCPAPLVCLNGACCSTQLPMCPNSKPASQTCSGPGTCPDGSYCHEDKTGQSRGCCEIPICPDGQVSVQPCSKDQLCPVGLQCIGNACCQLPVSTTLATTAMSTIPDAYLYPWLRIPTPAPAPFYPPAMATTAAQTTNSAPASGCANCCPALHIALCLCSQIKNICPQKTSCNNGACCAPKDVATKIQSKRRLGEACRSNNECPGYESGSSVCLNGHCICLPGTISNGLTCVKTDLVRQPLTMTPYAGAPANGYFYRRRNRRSVLENGTTTPASLKDMEMPDNIILLNGSRENVTEFGTPETELSGLKKFIYWRIFDTAFCVTDRECIPEMFCQNGTCQDAAQILNEDECSCDEECTRLLPNSFCTRPETPFQDQNGLDSRMLTSKVCQCKPGFVEYENLCLPNCPVHTVKIGNKCAQSHSNRKIKNFPAEVNVDDLKKSKNATFEDDGLA